MTGTVFSMAFVSQNNKFSELTAGRPIVTKPVKEISTKKTKILFTFEIILSDANVRIEPMILVNTTGPIIFYFILSK